MPRYGVGCMGKEGKAWTPAVGRGPFGQPRGAPSVAGEVHHDVGRHLREEGGEGEGKEGARRVRGVEGGWMRALGRAREAEGVR